MGRLQTRGRAELQLPDDGGGEAAIGGVGSSGTPAMQRPDVRWSAGDVIWHRGTFGRAVFVNQRADQLLLSVFVSPRQLGLYVS